MAKWHTYESQWKWHSGLLRLVMPKGVSGKYL